MKIKICTKCNKEKLLSEFSKDKNNLDGHRPDCKICKKQIDKIYYNKNSKNLKQYQKEYQDKNKEKISNDQKKYRDKHLNRLTIYKQNWDEINKNHLIKYRQKYYKNRRKIDIRFHLKELLYGRVYKALKYHYKSLSTMMLIGCEIDYLMYHIQEQFVDGMSWDNYGDWHIDHIKPCAKFDLSDPEEQHKCFNYSNLQPLWARENIKKSDKY